MITVNRREENSSMMKKRPKKLVKKGIGGWLKTDQRARLGVIDEC